MNARKTTTTYKFKKSKLAHSTEVFLTSFVLLALTFDNGCLVSFLFTATSPLESKVDCETWLGDADGEDFRGFILLLSAMLLDSFCFLELFKMLLCPLGSSIHDELERLRWDADEDVFKEVLLMLLFAFLVIADPVNVSLWFKDGDGDGDGFKIFADLDLLLLVSFVVEDGGSDFLEDSVWTESLPESLSCFDALEFDDVDFFSFTFKFSFKLIRGSIFKRFY